jgi:hypothetical protein
MKITCIKKEILYKGKSSLMMDLPITIGKSYDVIRKEIQGPQGPDYENGSRDFYLYEIKDDTNRITSYHEVFFDINYISEIRDKKIDILIN